jgi:hypothetical protein
VIEQAVSNPNRVGEHSDASREDGVDAWLATRHGNIPLIPEIVPTSLERRRAVPQKGGALPETPAVGRAGRKARLVKGRSPGAP